MPLSLAELRAACENKTKMRCDGYPRAMFVHQVFEAEREVSLGFKKGKGGYFEQADFEDVLGEWGADEPAEAEEETRGRRRSSSSRTARRRSSTARASGTTAGTSTRRPTPR